MCKKPRLLPASKLKSSVTFGFVLRSQREFDEFAEFMKRLKKDENCFMSVLEEDPPVSYEDPQGIEVVFQNKSASPSKI